MAHLRGFCIAVLTICLSSSLSAATLTVDLNGGADYTDIQSAIDAAKDGDTVLVEICYRYAMACFWMLSPGARSHGESTAAMPQDSSEKAQGESHISRMHTLILHKHERACNEHFALGA